MPGLTREDVAHLAGISADWYVKLEQGRSISPSRETIDALVAALRLDETERRHLVSLAFKEKRAPFQREEVSSALLATISQMSQPAWIIGDRWDIVAANSEAADLVDMSGIGAEEQNLIVWLLLDPRARSLLGPLWAAEAKRKVALFRAAYDLWLGDEAFRSIVELLQRESSEFPAWWKSHAIAEPMSGTKHLFHPARGRVEVRFALFRAMEDPRLKLLLYHYI